MTTFVRSAICLLTTFCLVSYIPSDGDFLDVYLYYLVRQLFSKSVLDVLYCRVTAFNKLLNSQVLACIR